jgi:DNA-binding NtrC family response regulator
MPNPEHCRQSDAVQGFQVLVFDERHAICRALCEFLTENGISVFGASTVNEAIGAIECSSVQGVIIDPWSGEHAGVELVRWIWQHRPPLRSRVVLTSSTTGDNGTIRMPADPPDVIGPSPPRLRQLLQTIRAWADETRA